MGSLISKLSDNKILILRLVLLVIFTAFIAGFAADQYTLIRGLVRVLCYSCIGLETAD